MLRRLWRPLGSLQMQVVWRLIGVAMLLSALRARGDQPLAIDATLIPLAYHAMTLSAVVLVAWGPRLLILGAVAASWSAILWTIFAGNHAHFRFVADEHLLFVSVPWFAVLAAVLQRQATQEAVQLWLLRLATVMALAFATLHKCNLDFLAVKTSCATLLGERLATRWSLPWGAPSPAQVIGGEALALVLLLVWPRIGALALLVLATGLGHVGPYAFNALLAAMAVAFVPASDVALWHTRARKTWPVLVVAATAVGSLSQHIYHGKAAWWPFFAFELVVVVAAWLVVLGWQRHGFGLQWRPQWRLPSELPLRRLCQVAVAFWLVQGFSPYMGLKMRLSFAMLSNLRADDSRWNSAVVPQWLLPRRSDGRVHVLEIQDDRGRALKFRGSAPVLRPGVYTGNEFRRRLAHSQRRPIHATLRLRHHGRELVFRDFTYNAELRQFAASLPEMRLFQSMLAITGRQQCVH